MIDLKDYQLVLASGSPRRKAFFDTLGIPFTIKTHPVDESFPSNLKGAAIAEYIAQKKLVPFAQNPTPNEIVVSADTIVWHQEQCLGKPKDTDDAIRMLQSLSGSTHEVISAVALLKDGKTTVFHCLTQVEFRTLKIEEIQHYVRTQAPMDKAGSYGIQDWIGEVGITQIKGSYTNVVGFPLSTFITVLANCLKE